MIAFLAAIAISAQDKSSVDRSAEQALRQMFTTVSQLHNAHLYASYYRVGSSDYYLPDHTNDFWLGNSGEYRVQLNSLSGDFSSLTVSDGVSVMTDPLDDDQTINISRSGKPMYEIVQREPLAYLLANAFDKFVAKDQPVVFATAPAGEKAIEFHSEDLGKVVIAYKDTANALPTRIDLFRAFRRRDAGIELPNPASREFIKLVSTGDVPHSLFTVVAPKGKKIQDDRTKTGS